MLRETVLPGTVFTRVAASHLRVGTFEYFAAQRDTEGIRILADYAIARHYREATQNSRPYRALLDAVVARQAALIARWMSIGFVHGVMNTDNTSISGETIDYGPCAFMEAYDPATVFSSIDARGRYAYGNQPRIALWNLTRLAEALLPLFQQEEGGEEEALTSAKQALEAFPQIFENSRLSCFRRKLGLLSDHEGDQGLIDDLLERMTANRADFTLTFRALCNAVEQPRVDKEVRALFADPTAYDSWSIGWRLRLNDEPTSPAERTEAMRKVNPAFIPRNHLVEAVINAAVERQDFQPFEELLAVTSRPYDDQPGRERYSVPARPEEQITQTFCGT